MNLSRRELLTVLGLSGLGLYATGCASQEDLAAARPDPLWPGIRPRPAGTAIRVPNPDGGATRGAGSVSPGPVTGNVGLASVGSLKAVPRSQWAGARPDTGKLNPMGAVKRITVHHEGWTAVTFDDATSTAKRMEAIRRGHLERLHAGDIGYHLVIDRAGRIWEGRDLRYQGAHVRDHNPNNIGVMVLGNFDLQDPTTAQLTTLRGTLVTLQKAYRVPVQMVYTHQELGPTECPGKGLQRTMVTMRRNGLA